MTGQTAIRPLGQPGDLGWVIKAHGEVYAREYGWDASFEALVAAIAAQYASQCDPAREAAWIAEADGQRAGCVFCVAADGEPATAQLRLLLTVPAARGLGLGAALVDTCMDFAREARYPRMLLWTNDVLTGRASRLSCPRLPADRQRAAPQLRRGPGRPDLRGRSGASPR